MCTHHDCRHSPPASPPFDRRRFLIAGAATGLLAACGGTDGGSGSVVALEIDRSTSCALDGMLLADYPGPKGQILYRGEREVHWFCDTTEVLDTLLRPEQVRPLIGAWVQDMAKADWERPQGHWVDARTAHYVLGSRRHGSMGPTAASFAEAAAAAAFVQQWGGRALAFGALTPEAVDLTGGALHDTRM